MPDEPYVLVAARGLVPPHEAVALTALAGRPGFTTMEPEDLQRFVPTGDLDVPQQRAYLVTGVDTGASTRGVRPDDALAVLYDQPFPGQGIARLLAIAPFFVMPTVSALVWKNLMMHPIYGVLGSVARGLGLEPVGQLVGGVEH